MTRLVRTRLAAIRNDDTGAGLVLVVGSMMVLSMLALTALASVTVSSRLARHSQDYQAAAAAAQAGVEEFISRVNRSDSYGSVVDCTNTAWRGPTTASNPCGWNSATPVGWSPVVPGETDPDAAWFHYSVDASRKTTEGTILLTSTGRVNGVYRTVETAVGKGGSTDYVYYTDFESADPANIQAYTAAEKSAMTAAQRAACGINGYSSALYWWKRNASGLTRSSYGCEEITFIDGDRLDGQVHTNDTIFASIRTSSAPKALFLEPVTTSDERCRTPGTTNAQWEDNCLRPSTSSLNGLANFNGKPPAYKEPLYLDDTSAQFVNHPGCHYYGSTRVIFHSNGRMTVWNKRVNNNNTLPVAIAGPDGVTPTCGTLDQLEAGADLPVPDDMVLYVGASSALMRECRRDEIGGPAGRTLPLGTYTGAAASAGGSYTRDVNMEEPTKACARGNLYAEGVVNGHVTLSSAESIIVTGDLVLADGRTESSTDLLGLVATNSVEVFHPRMVTVDATRNCTASSWSGCYAWGPYYWGTPSGESDPTTAWPTRYPDPTTGSAFPVSGVQIAGSIQTLQHSFLVQKYDTGSGSLGTLYVHGSIAQRWRGIVGKGALGYTKSYNYDKRLRFASPPYFPRWANAEWSLRYTGETNTPDNLRS